jgi:serine/threonine protein kinase/Tol biopolymer transport system component
VAERRWQRVKELFQAAVERPAGERDAFLDAAVGDDDALRREVESLLNSDAADDSFVDRFPFAAKGVIANSPLISLASTAQSESQPVLGPGDRVGPYEVIEPLGFGGMGEVYRTRDTKLNRDVALKVLPALVAADSDRLARFRREAQMLAALNHPNIAAIYGLEESPSVQALVLELVEGPTLGDLIDRGPISLEETLRMALQIAEALEAAHEYGIIHRDLKPANIKVRRDGVVKVLDFGLAKALAPDISAAVNRAHSPTVTAATQEGIILGTAAYMSPEQAKGQAVDRRADIWAFGCVLFEMLTGRPAFQGETVTDLLAAVVRDDPDWTAVPKDIPRAVQTLLDRCLKKDPRQRLQAIGDARIEIDAIVESPMGDATAGAVPSSSRTRATWLPWGILMVFVAVVSVWEARRSNRQLEDPLAGAVYSRFTDWEGTEGGAEISPDGRFVTFVADKAGQFDVWLSQVGTGRFQNLTADIGPLQPAFRIFRRLGFSGDGADIWFSLETGPSMAQMRLPMTGGTPSAFLDRNATAPSWSPDDARIVYFKNEDGDPLFVADRTGLDARQVLIQPGEHIHNPVWSSDSEWIYFARGLEPSESMDVWRVRPSGESPERLTERAIGVNFMTPLDSRTLLYVARAADRSGPWLWALDVERKVSRRVSTGLGQYINVSASRDGRHVVATVANPTASLWRVPLLDRFAEDRDVQPYPLPTARALAPRFAGKSLFYLSASGTGDGLWHVEDGQVSEVSKGADGGLFEPPAVSRDGRRAAIIVTREGRRQLVVVSSDGRRSQTLAASLEIQGAAGQGAADWSPDGASIVIGASDAQGPGLFKVSADGGEPVRLVSGKAQNPIWSPDGNLIVYAGRFFTGQVQLLGVRPDGTPVELPPVRTRPGGYRFLPDGKGLVYLPFIPSLDFWLFDFNTSMPRQLTRLSNQGAIGTFDITLDGKHIVFDRTRENSDIVLIELPRTR